MILVIDVEFCWLEGFLIGLFLGDLTYLIGFGLLNVGKGCFGDSFGLRIKDNCFSKSVC